MVLLGGAGVLVGLVGVLLPVVPGLLLVWLATIGTLVGTGRGGVLVYALCTVLLVVGTAASLVLPAQRGTAAGVPRRSLLLGLAGGVVGMVVLPVLGLPLGAAGGVLLAERERLGDWSPAMSSTRAVVTGYGLGVLVELLAGLLLAGVWLLTAGRVLLG